jgi:hypothetical protein
MERKSNSACGAPRSNAVGVALISTAISFPRHATVAGFPRRLRPSICLPQASLMTTVMPPATTFCQTGRSRQPGSPTKPSYQHIQLRRQQQTAFRGHAERNQSSRWRVGSNHSIPWRITLLSHTVRSEIALDSSRDSKALHKRRSTRIVTEIRSVMRFPFVGPTRRFGVLAHTFRAAEL